MADKKINIENLYSRESELIGLINDTYDYMDLKKPSIDKYVNHTKSALHNKSEWLGAQLAKSAQSGDFRKIIVGGALFGTALLVVNGAEYVGDVVAYQKAKNRLLPYYQELASKQGILQNELILTIQEKDKIIAGLSSNAKEYQKKLQELEEKQQLLTDLLTRFDNLQKLVEL